VVSSTRLSQIANYFQHTYRTETMYSLEPQSGYFLYDPQAQYTLSISSNKATLTVPYPVVILKGTGTGAVTIILPSLAQAYHVVSKITNTASHTITFKTVSGESVTFTIPAVSSSAPAACPGFTLVVDSTGNVYCTGYQLERST
jgi:hypothetical protein